MTDKATISDYAGLSFDDGYYPVYIPAKGIPLDGSAKMPRQLSPFVIRVIPPPVLQHLLQPAQDGTWRLQQSGGQKRASAYAAAARKQASQAAKTKAAKQDQGTAGASYLQPALVSSTTQVEEYFAAGQQQKAQTGAYRAPALADNMFLADVLIQLAALAAAPPLTLLISPNTFRTSYTKSQSFDELTREGRIFQSWGEEQPKLSIGGKVGAWYAGSPGAGSVGVATGVQWASRHSSAAWQQLMALFHLYKSSGHIRNTLSKQQGLHYTGMLAIEWDQFVYYGSMEGFGFGYEDTKPNGGMEFEFEFTVSRMFERAGRPTGPVSPLKSPMPSGSNPRSAAGSGVGNLDVPGFALAQRTYSSKISLNAPMPPSGPPKGGAQRSSLGFRKPGGG